MCGRTTKRYAHVPGRRCGRNARTKSVGACCEEAAEKASTGGGSRARRWVLAPCLQGSCTQTSMTRFTARSGEGEARLAPCDTEQDGSGLSRLSIMHSCLRPGRSDGVAVLSRGCLKAGGPCNRRQTSNAVGRRHRARARSVQRARPPRSTWHLDGGWAPTGSQHRLAVVPRSNGLGQSVAAVVEALWRLGWRPRLANHRSQCVWLGFDISDALFLRIGIPTCASLQPPAGSSLCPVPLPCSPQSLPSSPKLCTPPPSRAASP